MSTAAERADQLDLVARLKSSYPELPDAPTPDLLDHDRFTAYMKPVHDVGGEPDAPITYENKQYEYWEHMTYVHLRGSRLARDLAVRGTSADGQRRRRARGLSGSPLLRPLAAGRSRGCLVEKHHIGLTELSRADGRGAAALRRRAGRQDLEAKPKFEGDGSQVKRNSHHRRRRGQGRPAGATPGRPARRSSRSATR